MLERLGHSVAELRTFNYSLYASGTLTGDDVARYRAMERDPELREIILAASIKPARACEEADQTRARHRQSTAAARESVPRVAVELWDWLADFDRPIVDAVRAGVAEEAGGAVAVLPTRALDQFKLEADKSIDLVRETAERLRDHRATLVIWCLDEYQTHSLDEIEAEALLASGWRLRPSSGLSDRRTGRSCSSSADREPNRSALRSRSVPCVGRRRSRRCSASSCCKRRCLRLAPRFSLSIAMLRRFSRRARNTPSPGRFAPVCGMARSRSAQSCERRTQPTPRRSVGNSRFGRWRPMQRWSGLACVRRDVCHAPGTATPAPSRGHRLRLLVGFGFATGGRPAVLARRRLSAATVRRAHSGRRPVA